MMSDKEERKEKEIFRPTDCPADRPTNRPTERPYRMAALNTQILRKKTHPIHDIDTFRNNGPSTDLL